MAAEDYEDLIWRLKSFQPSLPSEHPLRKDLYDTLRTLLPSLEDPQDTISRIAYSPLQLAVAKVGSDLGLFELLDARNSGVGVAEIARLTHSSPVLFGRLLRYLAATNIIKEVGENTFAPTNVTRVLSTPGFKAGLIHNFEVVMPCWQHLPKFLKDTSYENISNVLHSPFQIAHKTDQPAFIWAMGQPELERNFNLWMTATHQGQRSCFDVFPPQKFCADSDEKTILFVDIGGGIGHQSAALKTRLIEAQIAGRVVLQDQRMAIEHAIPTEGVEKMEFDFWGQQPIQGARAYYLRNILHDYPDEKCIEILHNTMRAMDSESLILIDEMVLPETGVHWHAAQHDLTMMSCLAAMERTQKQWHELLGKAGLRIQKIAPYTEETRESVIVAVSSGVRGH